MPKQPKARRKSGRLANILVALKKFIMAAIGILLSARKKLFQRRSWNWLFPKNTTHQLRSISAFGALLYNFFVKVPWVVAIIVIAVILIQGLTQQITVIEPISVPKELADRGYTAQVAARRLGDAIQKYSDNASSLMKSPGVAMHGELPKLVVPAVGISLDAVIATFRTMFNVTRSRTLSGELVVKDNNLLSLQLRLDGRKLETEDVGVYPYDADRLMRTAVPKVIDELAPYLIAITLAHEGRKEEALQKANEIIAMLPSSDGNVIWAHNLRGNLYAELKRPREVIISEYNKALKLDRNFAPARINLGNLYKNSNDIKRATAEYREAIFVDRKLALAHYNLGVILTDPKEKEAAYREALKWNPKFGVAHGNLGNLLTDTEEQITRYKLAAKFDPNNYRHHYNLGNVLPDLEKKIEAYEESIRQKSDYASAYNSMGLALMKKEQWVKAHNAFEEVLRIEPNHERARNNLEQVKRKMAEVTSLPLQQSPP